MNEAPATGVLEWIRPEFQERQEELIHLAHAAKIAGVTRACVSNWHRRHQSFQELIVARGRDGGHQRLVYLPEAEFRRWIAQRPSRAEAVPGGAKPTGIDGKKLAVEKAKNHREALEKRLARAEAEARELRKRIKRAKELEAARAEAFSAELEAARRLFDEDLAQAE
ncbi:hypothetical protein ABZ502_32720 [Streptomyces abikoensis]|uniref:hypothetical protein n=1 Tax=Streptomyces abikoensis TaxID=97398 RepID=UPI0033C61EEF